MNISKYIFILIALIFSLISISVCAAEEAEEEAEEAEQAEDEEVSKKNEIERIGIYCGLDPGIMVLDTPANDYQRYIRFNLRVGYGFKKWVHLGTDLTGDILMDSAGGEPLAGDLYFQPMVTFFPVAGFNIRAGGGIDTSDVHRWINTAAIGYEFGLDRHGGIGLQFVYNQFWHTDKRSPWRMYGVVFYLSAYNLGKIYNLNDDDNDF